MSGGVEFASVTKELSQDEYLKKYVEMVCKHEINGKREVYEGAIAESISNLIKDEAINLIKSKVKETVESYSSFIKEETHRIVKDSMGPKSS